MKEDDLRGIGIEAEALQVLYVEDQQPIEVHVALRKTLKIPAPIIVY